MRDNSVHIPKKGNPVLLDKVIQGLQERLSEKLDWLDYVFGRAYKLVEHRSDGNKYTYPACYVGNGEYVSVVPNDSFGNFCWFDVYDPQEIDSTFRGRPRIGFDGAIIFWYDQSSIYPDATALHTEEVKNEILSVLSSSGLMPFPGRIQIKKVFEEFENIYKGYSIEKIYNNYTYSGQDVQEMDKQFFMYPFAGLRIEFTINTHEACLPSSL